MRDNVRESGRILSDRIRENLTEKEKIRKNLVQSGGIQDNSKETKESRKSKNLKQRKEHKKLKKRRLGKT